MGEPRSMNAQLREKMNIHPAGQSSPAELIERLATAQELITVKKEAAELKAKLQQKERDHVQEMSATLKKAGDPIQTAIDILQDHKPTLDKLAAAEAEIQSLTDQLAQDKVDFEELKAMTQKQYDSAIEITKQRDSLIDERDALMERKNADVSKANGTITKLQAQLSAAQRQNKEYVSLNPARMQKQLKEAKTKNKELTESNQELRKKVSLNKKTGQALIDLKADHTRLEYEYCSMHRALDEAVDDLNRGHKPKSIEVIHGWEVYGSTESEDILVIRDPATGIERPYHRETGLAKATPVPAKVQAAMVKIFEQMDQVRSHLPTGESDA